MISGSVVVGGTVSPHHKYVAVTLITDETLTFPAEVKTRVGEVYSQACSYLHQLGMQDTHLFGLVTTIDGENVFADPECKLSKYAPKSWKTSSSGMDASGEPLLQFRLRVQFYVETHLLLRDGLSRLHYYLQLRENVLSYNQSISEEATFLLAAYALQADLGDFCEDQHHGHYFDPNLYFPQWLVERVGVAYVLEHVPHMHRDNLGLTRAEAHAQYIREASQQEAPHNLHLYRLRYKKQDPSPQVVMAICARGLDIYEEEPGQLHTSRKLISNFQWSTIGKLSFEPVETTSGTTSPITYQYDFTKSEDRKDLVTFIEKRQITNIYAGFS
nr:FERM domain-containing protein 6-like [Procambarus clarkii]